MSYAEALDVALCYGWIDGQKRALDDDHWLQRFTPRGPRSRWSKVNREQGDRADRAGPHEAGGAARDRAREGRRPLGRGLRRPAQPRPCPTTYDGAGRATGARGFFATLDSRNRYAILYRIQDAKKPETRARRIEKYVAMLAEGQTIHP